MKFTIEKLENGWYIQYANRGYVEIDFVHALNHILCFYYEDSKLHRLFANGYDKEYTGIQAGNCSEKVDYAKPAETLKKKVEESLYQWREQGMRQTKKP